MCKTKSEFDIITVSAIFYLTLPLYIYFAGWLKPTYSLIAITIISLGLFHATSPISNIKISLKQAINTPNSVIIFTAVTWSIFGGAGHLFFANPDWPIRDAVLRDLTVGDWPPSYGEINGYDLILRAPLGYYLPASLIGKLVGLNLADTLLWLWTVCGLIIFFKLLPQSENKTKNFISLVVIIIFSGMDIIGWLKVQPYIPVLGSHLEWWAGLFQYSSNTTQIFWVPNHALPGWIAIALFYRHKNTPGFSRTLPFICAILPLWSPFAAIGFVPFVLTYIAHKTQAKELFKFNNLWAPTITLAIYSPYLLLDMQTIPLESTAEGTNTPLQFFIHYGFFLTIEFFILSLLIYDKSDRTLLLTCLATLSLLPFLHFGPGNDIVMRGGIPALMLICIMTVHYILEVRKFNFRILLLVLTLLVGAITPLQEFYRALSNNQWSPNLHNNLLQASTTPVPHYIAQLNNPLLTIILKTPKPVP